MGRHVSLVDLLHRHMVDHSECCLALTIAALINVALVFVLVLLVLLRVLVFTTGERSVGSMRAHVHYDAF